MCFAFLSALSVSVHLKVCESLLTVSPPQQFRKQRWLPPLSLLLALAPRSGAPPDLRNSEAVRRTLRCCLFTAKTCGCGRNTSGRPQTVEKYSKGKSGQGTITKGQLLTRWTFTKKGNEPRKLELSGRTGLLLLLPLMLPLVLGAGALAATIGCVQSL